MPTSAPSSRRAAGFTLVEMMVVLVIVGLAGATVLLTLPTGSRGVRDEADRLALQLARARDEAVLGNREVEAVVDADGIAFRIRRGGEWQPLADGPLRTLPLADGTHAEFARGRERARFGFDPTGLATATAVTLVRDGARAEIRVDGAGEIVVDAR